MYQSPALTRCRGTVLGEMAMPGSAGSYSSLDQTSSLAARSKSSVASIKRDTRGRTCSYTKFVLEFLMNDKERLSSSLKGHLSHCHRRAGAKAVPTVRPLKRLLVSEGRSTSLLTLVPTAHLL